ncbi:hypothetical protein Godav_023424 [Gossypium davidsonii]|uniref:Uncharacterized protein n=1 Tax=Gossypium davidsonii TaxID=34287 RepID=A0A7J8SRL4_GOSDV|nr:hypothetical protein [Gossypium davidsonii]
MSRCFPFPPPGYEKKARTDDADFLKKVNTVYFCSVTFCLTQTILYVFIIFFIVMVLESDLGFWNFASLKDIASLGGSLIYCAQNSSE